MSPVCYWRYRWREILGHLPLYMYVVVLALLSSYWVLLICFLVAAKQVRDWIRLREHLYYGCLNAAVVLDAEQMLVATYTNLRASGDRPVPVIKVVRERLNVVRWRRFNRGERVATVAVYRGLEVDWAGARWRDFSPIVVDCLTNDPAASRRAMEDIPAEDWAALERGLSLIGTGSRPGLHDLDGPAELPK